MRKNYPKYFLEGYFAENFNNVYQWCYKIFICGEGIFKKNIIDCLNFKNIRTIYNKLLKMFSFSNKKKANKGECTRIEGTKNKKGYYIDDTGNDYDTYEMCMQAYKDNDKTQQDRTVINPMHENKDINGGKRKKSAKRRQKKSKTAKKLQKTMGGKSGKKRRHKKNKSAKK